MIMALFKLFGFLHSWLIYQVTPLAPVPFPSQPHEPLLPALLSYDGNPGTCRSFLSQYSLVLGLQALPFPTECSKMAYVITLLLGRAHKCSRALWEPQAQAPCCTEFYRSCTGLSLVKCGRGLWPFHHWEGRSWPNPQAALGISFHLWLCKWVSHIGCLLWLGWVRFVWCLH